MDLSELIYRIGYIRNRANLSARKLSIEIGKAASYINLMEMSKSFAPSFQTLCDILEVCNSSIEEFFYYSIPDYRSDKEIIELLKGLSPEKKDAIFTLLKK